MLSLGRSRGHLVLLAIIVALVLGACGGSSSSSSSHSSSPVAAGTSSTKSATKHAAAKHHQHQTAATTPAKAHHGGKLPPKPTRPPHRPERSAAERRLLQNNPLGAAFSVADSTYTRFVYRPLVTAPAGTKTSQHFTLLRASAAVTFVNRSLTAASHEAQLKPTTASLVTRLNSLATQADTIRVVLLKSAKPTSTLQSLRLGLASMATELKARGVKLFILP